MSTPLVSICCLTYNHAKFIQQCLDGFLMQKTDFSIEILIHDDASTDGTDDIIREYTAKYPNLIFPLFETENQYSKGHAGEMDIKYNYSRARGKYIAYCEGDDYWTNALKLQKQVDFMEGHPEYSVCFHGVEVNDLRNNRRYLQKYHLEEGCDTDINFFKDDHFLQPLTMLFRKSMYSFNWAKQYHGYCDTHEIYHLLREGKGRFLNFYGGVYNQHMGGISAGVDAITSCEEIYVVFSELYLYNQDDDDLKKCLQTTLLWILDVYRKNGMITLYLKTIKDILFDVPDLWSYIMWSQIKRTIKRIVKRLVSKKA